MSYLDVPRLTFSGIFFTDPSTVNNDPYHYQLEDVEPSPWQNPIGQHRFQFKNVLTMSALLPDGPSANDPLLGAELISTDQPSPAKIVDCVQAALDKPFTEGLATERELFVQCLNSPQRAGLVHAFFAEREVTKSPETQSSQPRPFQKVGVIGGGNR